MQSNKNIVALQYKVIARRDAATSLVHRLKGRRESDRCATRLSAFRNTFARIRRNDAVRRPCDQIRESTVITGLDSSLWASEETRDWFNEGAPTPRTLLGRRAAAQAFNQVSTVSAREFAHLLYEVLTHTLSGKNQHFAPPVPPEVVQNHQRRLGQVVGLQGTPEPTGTSSSFSCA